MTTAGNDFGFDPDALTDTAAVLYRMARAGRATVLQLGSGADGVCRALSARGDMKVTRVVAGPDAPDAEVTHGIEVIAADLDTEGWYAGLDGRTFDVVVVTDLLEHLRDPERVLRDLREQHLLADDGRLLVGFANVAHEAVASELLSGRSARIRWYTASSMNRLLAASGYLVTETHHISRPGTDDEAQTYAYVLRAQPSAAGPQLALLHQQLDEVTRRLAEVESFRDQIRALLEERAAFRDEIGRGADELEQVQNKLDRVTDERSALRNDINRLHRKLARLQDEHAVAKTAIGQLAAIRQSRSYRWSRGLARAAQVVVTPVRTVRQRMRGGR